MGRDREEVTHITATEAGLTGCQRCGHVWPEAQTHCGHCGSRLRKVSLASLERVWALWWAGLFAYIPANLYPIMHTQILSDDSPSTIMGGVIVLMHHHDYGIALIVFLASICIPIAKFVAIAFLALSAKSEKPDGRHKRTVLYELVEFLGRWSMVDVFVVAILSALVQLGVVARIYPGPAAAAFALSVALTMLSAQSFDPRLIWRRAERRPSE